MDQFDDNGWNEIWELFGKDQKHSPYKDKTKNKSVGDDIGFAETGVIADTGTTCKLEITFAWPEWTNGGGRQLTSCDEIECSDEIKVAGTTPQTDCQSDIYEAYDSNEDSPDDDEYDVNVQKFTDAAGDEIFKECSKDDGVGQKFTSDTTVDEILKECYKGGDENDLVGQKFTSDTDVKTVKERWSQLLKKRYSYIYVRECYRGFGQKFTGDPECDQDGGENHSGGRKFTNYANCEPMRDCYKDESEKELFGEIFASETDEECNMDVGENDPIGQKFTCDAGGEIFRECYKDVGENDPVGDKFTCDAGGEIFRECYKDVGKNDPVGENLTCDVGGETFKECYKGVGDSDPVGEKLTSDAGDETIQECYQDDGENHSARRKFTCETSGIFGKEWYTDGAENGYAEPKLKSALKLQDFEAIGAVPNDAETGISPNAVEVATELDDVLPAIERRHQSHAVLKGNISAKKERKSSNGISRYKVSFVANLFQFTLSECVKASSIKRLLQAACFFAGFFSCISGSHGESVSPRDAVVDIGATVRFQCSWDMRKPVYWQWTSVHSQNSLFLYIGNGGLVDSADDGISIDIDRDKGRYDLVITGVLLKHAGTYTCIENSGLGRSMSAELTVLGNCQIPMLNIAYTLLHFLCCHVRTRAVVFDLHVGLQNFGERCSQTRV